MPIPTKETLDTLFHVHASFIGNNIPLRMDRSAAKRMVNRNSDRLFDEFCDKHGIKEAVYGKSNKREYYAIDLAAAITKDYEDHAQL